MTVEYAIKYVRAVYPNARFEHITVMCSPHYKIVVNELGKFFPTELGCAIELDVAWMAAAIRIQNQMLRVLEG